VIYLHKTAFNRLAKGLSEFVICFKTCFDTAVNKSEDVVQCYLITARNVTIQCNVI